MWRSPVAHTPGGRGVAGSNPVIPTEQKGLIISRLSGLFLAFQFKLKLRFKHSLNNQLVFERSISPVLVPFVVLQKQNSPSRYLDKPSMDAFRCY